MSRKGKYLFLFKVCQVVIKRYWASALLKGSVARTGHGLE